MEPLHIFFHVACIGNWSSIFDEIILSLESSGVLKNAILHISVCGAGYNKITKYTTVHQTNDVKLFEFPTLHYMWQHCKKYDGAVLYLHTKGATRNGKTVDQWRDLMLHFCVKRWQMCLHYLHEYDASGCNLQYSNDIQFFSGNFWWAGSCYIRSLPDPNLYINSRIQAELWIGMNKRASFFNLHSSNVNHYNSYYEKNMYTHC